MGMGMGMGVRVGMGMGMGIGIGIGMQYQCTPPARLFRIYAPTSASAFEPNGRNGGGLGAGLCELREVSVIHVHYITTHRNAGDATACPSRAGSRRSCAD